MTVRRSGQVALQGASTAGFATGHTLNMIDALATPAGSGADQTSAWTTGASLAQVIPAPGPLPDKAEIISFEVRANLGFHSSAAEPAYGKLGKILAALQFGAYPFATNLTSVPLPQDATLIGTLWDPAIDPLPPDDSTNPPTLLPVTLLNVLAQPVPILEQVIAVGVWFTPSLLVMKAGGFAVRALTMYDAIVEVIYDDGR